MVIQDKVENTDVVRALLTGQKFNRRAQDELIPLSYTVHVDTTYRTGFSGQIWITRPNERTALWTCFNERGDYLVVRGTDSAVFHSGAEGSYFPSAADALKAAKQNW